MRKSIIVFLLSIISFVGFSQNLAENVNNQVILRQQARYSLEAC
jgi:hypothetical protein